MSVLDYSLPEQLVGSPHAARGDPPALCIRLLGGFCITVGSRVIDEEDWRLQKAGHLVKLLALAPRHRLGQEQATDLLWTNLDPVAARNNFHRTLYDARRTLATERGVALLPLRQRVLFLESRGLIWVDVDAFEVAAATARRHREVEPYHAAIALYSGELLPHDRYVDLFAERRELLRQTFIELLMTVARLHSDRGEPAAAVEIFQRVVGVEPSCEEAHVELMRLYAVAGQRHRAFQQYALLQKALRRELDAEPSPASKGLYAEIRAGRLHPKSSR